MFKTLISKFTILYWIFFLFLIVPLYLFAILHFQNVLKESEEEKITLTFNTLKPIIAFNISFDQEELIEETLESFFEHPDVHSVKLTTVDGNVLFFKDKDTHTVQRYFQYSSFIEDPFTGNRLATAAIEYSNEHLDHLVSKLLLLLGAIFAFALAVFMMGFLYLRDDLNGLAKLSRWLKQYMETKKLKAIEIPGKSTEVRTIATVANEMVRNISEHVGQLKDFNQELKVRVEEALAKQHDQEHLMIHQSRQAAMGEMLESIAHQWRQPLNNIGLAVSNIETKHVFGTLDDREFEEKMKIISDNIHYMSDTIDDFRNFLTPDREMHLFKPEKTINDVFGILGAQLCHNAVGFNVQSDCNLQLFGIENEFKQVLLILINNAKDAIKEQMLLERISHGEIDIHLFCQEEKAVIQVWDNGGGIDPKIRHSIFEPYFTTKFKNQGTGIGLYLAKNIIEERMNGTLTADNIGSGSCFTVVLPVNKENHS